MINITPGRVATLADVAIWAETHRSVDDRRALARVEKLWEHMPLSARKVDLAAFDRAFPLHGFDPVLHKSEDAYKAWRRKVGAVIKDYLAQTAPKPVVIRPASASDAGLAWTRLLEAVADYADSDGGADFTIQRTIPIRVLARRATQLSLGPKDLTPPAMLAVGDGLDGNDRGSIIRALRNLNTLRSVRQIACFLPDEPYGLTPWPRRFAIGELPEHLAEEIEHWIDRSCRGKLDPVSGITEGGTSKSDRDKKRVALRRYCVAAIASTGGLASDRTLADLMTERFAIGVLQFWMKPAEGKAIARRTIASYFRCVKTVAARNGVEVKDLSQLEDRASILRDGGKEDSQMSPRVRKFCEAVISVPAIQVKLMTLHVRARRIAQQILDGATAGGRELTESERGRVRQLGVVAAFSAIETCGVPLRLANAMTLTFRGPSATFLLPTSAKPFARIILPGKQVKNSKPIDAPLKQDVRNGLDTVMWFLKHIHPLFERSAHSDYLFPAVTSSGRLSPKVFRTWFKRISRQLGIPMCPHNFRHALASLLIKSRPGQYESVAVLLGDTESTVRLYYAWVNKQVQVEAAQALVLELANVA